MTSTSIPSSMFMTKQTRTVANCRGDMGLSASRSLAGMERSVNFPDLYEHVVWLLDAPAYKQGIVHPAVFAFRG